MGTDTMMRRMPLRELHQYLNQQIWYYKNVHSNSRSSSSGNYTEKDNCGNKQTTTTKVSLPFSEDATTKRTLNEMIIRRRRTAIR